MKEVIIKYKDSRVLEVLKSLAVHLNFSISEIRESKGAPTLTEGNNAKAFVNQWAGFISSTNEFTDDFMAERDQPNNQKRESID